MGDILSRIAQIADNEGIKIGAMERKIGASKGVLSRAIANGTDIQSKWIQLIVENFPLYSAAWLLTGAGPMLREQTDIGSTAAPAIEAGQTIESQVNTDVDQRNPLVDLVRELTAKIEVLAKENGELRGRLNILELERRSMFIHSGGGKFPSPVPPATPSAAVQPEASSRPTSSPQSGSPRPVTRCDVPKTARK